MRIGIVGTGNLIKELMPVLAGMKEIDIIALCGTERSKQTVYDICSEYDIAYGFTDYESFLKVEMDAVYIAIPNHLHFEYAVKAINSDKNVIIEKPICLTYEETNSIFELAWARKLYVFEAITTMYQPNYLKIRELLGQIGEIKLVQCNFSQYSSRYDRFKAGELPAVFDSAKGGGALMDLNIYNIYYVAGLFGEPEDARYFPNIEQNIDVSGVAVMDYASFKAVCVAAKDSQSPARVMIQGTKGYILQESTPNICGKVLLHMNDGSETSFNIGSENHRITAEFKEFNRILQEDDREKCLEMMKLSALVSDIITNVSREQ